MFDVLKWLYTGQMKFNDLWKGTYAKHSIYSPEHTSGTIQTYNQAFRWVPNRYIVPYLEKWSDGAPKVKNIQGMIWQLVLLEQNEKDPNVKTNLRSQIQFLRDLQKDPNGENILNQALLNMGLTYDGMVDKPDETADKITDETTKRAIAFTTYAQQNWWKLKDDVKSHAEYKKYLQSWKPTLEEMKNADLFEALPGWTPPAPVEYPEEKLDAWLRTLDRALATKLQKWMDEWIADSGAFKNSAERPEFVMMDKWVLTLKSYGMQTPISMKDGKFYVGAWLNIPFDDAKHALWTANLTNRLIKLYTWKFDTDKPFRVLGWDIRVGEAWLIWLLLWKEAVDGADKPSRPWETSTIKDKIGGDALEINKEAYVTWMNGFYNSNATWNKSVWLKNNWVTTTTNIARYFDAVPAMPLLKSIAPTIPWTTPGTTPPIGPDVPTPSVEETPEMKKMKEAIDEIKNNQSAILADQKKLKEYIVANAWDAFTESVEDKATITKLATEWKTAYDAVYKKDPWTKARRDANKAAGGDDGMPLDFYEAWVKAYGKTGNHQPVFIYKNTNYFRRWWDLPPTRHISKAIPTWGVWKLR